MPSRFVLSAEDNFFYFFQKPLAFFETMCYNTSRNRNKQA